MKNHQQALAGSDYGLLRRVINSLGFQIRGYNQSRAQKIRLRDAIHYYIPFHFCTSPRQD